jgi:hypothetical protein
VTESGEVLYPWHPWFGRVVYFHQLIELGREHILRCDLGEKPTARCMNVPAWMFDRAACLRVRRADTPQVELAALICLKALLAEVANRTYLVAAVVGARHSFENRGDADAAAEPSITNDPTRSVPSVKSASAQLPGLPAEVQEKVTRLIVRMLSQHEPANPAVRRDGGGDDE